MEVNPVYSRQRNNSLPMTNLRDGQLVHGRVLRFDQQGRAVIELGGSRFLAEIRAQLDTLKTYWFQVQKNGAKIMLQVLAASDREDVLLRRFGLEPHTTSKQILLAVKNWRLPLDQVTMMRVSRWLDRIDDVQMGLQVIRFMYEHHLPITERVFFSLLPLWQGRSLGEEIGALHDELASFQVIKDLREPLHYFTPTYGKSFRWTDGDDVYRAFVRILTLLGWGKERDPKAGERNLLKVIQKILVQNDPFSSKIATRIGRIIHLLSVSHHLFREQDGFIQGMFILPLPLPERTVDLQIQWTGKRTERGRLDPDFCQIVFFLEMPRLGRTEVTMQVQKRHITLTVKTDFPQARKLGEILLPSLKEKLVGKNYVLNSVRFEKLSRRKDSPPTVSPEVLLKRSEGLDVRV